MDLSRYDFSWRLVFAAERLLSRYPDAIIANSFSGLDYICEKGFKNSLMAVVPNGIDIAPFRKSTSHRNSFRAEIGVKADDFVVGIVARLDPMKGHEVFIRAAEILCDRLSDVVFVCVGAEGLITGDEILQRAHDHGLSKRFRWLGHRTDVSSVLSGLDVSTSASIYGEGFSNVIAESMAAGALCVATDVGDSARILSDTGLVVPPSDAEALAEAWASFYWLSAEQRDALRHRARVRVENEFGRDEMVLRMADVYNGLVE